MGITSPGYHTRDTPAKQGRGTHAPRPRKPDNRLSVHPSNRRVRSIQRPIQIPVTVRVITARNQTLRRVNLHGPQVRKTDKRIGTQSARGRRQHQRSQNRQVLERETEIAGPAPNFQVSKFGHSVEHVAAGYSTPVRNRNARPPGHVERAVAYGFHAGRKRQGTQRPVRVLADLEQRGISYLPAR